MAIFVLLVITAFIIIVSVIRTFACKRTKQLFETGKASGFIRSIEKQAKRKLIFLHVAENINDFGEAPGLRLEALKGKRKGQWSIRINNQYRICFRFDGGNALDVEITDYH